MLYYYSMAGFKFGGVDKLKIKKSMLLVPVVFLSLCFTWGCSEQKSAVVNKGLDASIRSVRNDTVIPCLVYQEQGDKVVALIAKWKLESGTLDIGKEQAFSLNNKNDTSFPMTWDGGNSFVLPDSYVLSDQYKSSSKLIPQSKQKAFLGENIKLTIYDKPNGNFDKYAVEVEYNGEKIRKEIRLNLKYQDKSGNSYNLVPNELAFTYAEDKYAYFFYRPVTNAVGFIAVKYNLVTNEKSLNTIADEAEQQLFAGNDFNQGSVENIGGEFYSFTSDGIGMVDVNQNKFKYLKELSENCKNYMVSTVEENEYPRYLGVSGEYKCILIISVPVKTGKTNEALYCAVKDNKIIAAIYIQDHIMQLMDANKNIKSEINLKEKKLNSYMPLSFPVKNGIKWG